MTLATLIAWIALHAPVADWHRKPIPRPDELVTAVATAALEHSEVDAKTLAATLVVLAAHEGGNRVDAAGDCPGLRPGDRHCTLARGSRSVGPWQTRRSVTPIGDLTAQARVAADQVILSWQRCPRFPLSVYASGQCVFVGVASEYAREISLYLKETVDEVAGAL